MTRARSLSRLANTNAFTVDGSNNVGIGSTQPDVRLDVNGDMNVTGTLTYEDVTNVETAGITTTGGLVVTGLGATIGGITTFFGDINFGAAGVGGTVTTLGHAEFAGVVTASSYRGDGSQLTGVDSSNLIDSGDTNRVAANTSGIVVTGIATVTGDVSIADKIIHTGDTNTAIRFPAADTFTVETSGSERVRVNSSGDIGITSTSPRAKLDIKDGGTSQDVILRVSADDSNPYALVVGNDDFNRTSNRGFAFWVGTDKVHHIEARTSTTNSENEIVVSAGDAISFRTNVSEERLRVSGVGTVMLRANQGTAETNIIRFEDTDTSAAANQKFGQLQWYSNDASGAGACVKGEIYVAAQDTTPDGYMVFATHDGGSSTVATERMRIISDGRIGVGTDKDFNAGSMTLFAAAAGEGTATGQLELKDTANFNATPTGGIIFSGRHTAGSTAIFAGIRGFKSNTGDGDVDGSLAFDIRKEGGAAYEAMRINEDGEVNIGPGADPRKRLDITGPDGRSGASPGNSDTALIIDNDGGNGAIVEFLSDNNAFGRIFFTDTDASNRGQIVYEHSSDAFQFSTAGSERLRITSAGNITPGADNSQDLGSTSKRWANIYSADLQLSNEGMGNDVDGTWGQYTIQEGENDLFLLNRRNGKTYKFVLEEVN